MLSNRIRKEEKPACTCYRCILGLSEREMSGSSLFDIQQHEPISRTIQKESMNLPTTAINSDYIMYSDSNIISSDSALNSTHCKSSLSNTNCKSNLSNTNCKSSLSNTHCDDRTWNCNSNTVSWNSKFDNDTFSNMEDDGERWRYSDRQCTARTSETHNQWLFEDTKYESIKLDETSYNGSSEHPDIDNRKEHFNDANSYEESESPLYLFKRTPSNRPSHRIDSNRSFYKTASTPSHIIDSIPSHKVTNTANVAYIPEK